LHQSEKNVQASFFRWKLVTTLAQPDHPGDVDAKPSELLSLTIFTTSLAVGQVMFKRVGMAIRGQPLLDSVFYLLSSPTLYMVVSIYVLSTFLWIWILSQIPLTRAYPWVAVGMAIVPLLRRYVFDEGVEPLFWLGISLFLVGLIITQYASNKSG
jgi:multidrug transporter EmrE-like cation transporter